MTASERAVRWVGVPWDAHSSYLEGCAQAPAALRRALADAASNSWTPAGLDLRDPAVLVDAGDVSVSGEFASIREGIAAHLATGGPLVAVGGDHATTFPVFAATAARHPGLTIVHLDAHGDLYDDFEGDPLSHASPFARIMERGLAGGLVQVGIRTDNPHQRAQRARFGGVAFGPEELDEALRALPATPCYLSLDLDVLEPGLAPGVSHHEPGGLTVREAIRVVRALPGPLVGADIVELNPSRDVADMTARVAVKLLKEIVDRMHAS